MIGLQAILSAGSRVFATGLLFLATVIVARILGPQGQGLYILATTLAATVTQFANLGLHTGNIYQLARDPKLLSPIIGNSLVISLLFGGAAAALAVLISSSGPQLNDLEFACLCLGAAMAPCRLFFTLGGNIFVGLHQIRTFNLMMVVNYSLVLLSVIVAAVLNPTIESFLWGTLAGWLLANVVLLGLLLKQVGFRISYSWPVFQDGFVYAAKAYVVCLLGFLMLRANVFLLQGLAATEEIGHYEVGLYSVPSNLMDALNLLPASLALVLFPRLIKNEGSNRWSMTMKGTGAIALFMLAACGITAFLAEPAVRFAFGEKYLPALGAIRWILPAAFFCGLTSVTSQYIAAIGFPRSVIGIWALGLCVMVGSSIPLIPHWGAVGAAVSLSLSYAVVFVLQVGLVWYYEVRSSQAPRQHVPAILPKLSERAA